MQGFSSRLGTSELDRLRSKSQGINDGDITKKKLIYNSMAGGTYHLQYKNSDTTTSLTIDKYHDAISKDLAQHRKLSLSEVYLRKEDPDALFSYFLDIDHKFIDTACNSVHKTYHEYYQRLLKKGFNPTQQIDKNQFKIPKDECIRFPMTEEFILDISKEAINAINLMLTNTQNLVVHLTTTMDKEGFKPFQEKIDVCPWCLNEIHIKHACSKCNAKFNRNKEYIPATSRYQSLMNVSKDVWCNFKSFQRTKYSFGFHLRFSNLKVNLDQAFTITHAIKDHFRKYEKVQKKYDFPNSFLTDLIDMSVYGVHKGLRVIHTLKCKDCINCKLLSKKRSIASMSSASRNRVCFDCRRGKLFVIKPYRLLGTFYNSDLNSSTIEKPINEEIDSDEEDIDYYVSEDDGSFDAEPIREFNPQASSKETFTFASDQFNDIQETEAIERANYNKASQLATERMVTLAPFFTPNLRHSTKPLKKKLFLIPRNKDEYNRELRLCSLLTDTSNTIIPQFDSTFPLLIDDVKSKKNCRFRSEDNENLILKRGHKNLDRGVIPSAPADLPNTYVQKIQQAIRQFSEEYNQLFVDRIITYYDKKKSRLGDRSIGFYKVTVNGTGSRFCNNICRCHRSNRIYFIIQWKCIKQNCFNQKSCLNYNGEERELDRELAKMLFPDRFKPTSVEDDDFILDDEELICPNHQDLITAQARHYLSKFPDLFVFKIEKDLGSQNTQIENKILKKVNKFKRAAKATNKLQLLNIQRTRQDVTSTMLMKLQSNILQAIKNK